MHVVVIGTGYVGLVTGAGLAEVGHDVICIDRDPTRIERLNRAEMPFYEPGLDEMVGRGVGQGRLKFVSSEGLRAAVQSAEVVFLAVGTPPKRDGSADLRQLESAVTEVRSAIALNALVIPPLVVTKSTVPPGTTKGLVRSRVARAASNPEFLKEGDAVRDFMRPDRVVIGVDCDDDAAVLERLYAPFVRTGAPVLRMDPTSAELAKYANNAMLATRISLMNEIAAVADLVGADIDHVRRAVGCDKRIGPSFLFAGVGWGGSCFGKDVHALAHTAKEHKLWPVLLEATGTANELATSRFVDRVTGHFDRIGDGRALTDRAIAVWGLSFKPGTDDVRDAPSIKIIRALADRGAKVFAHDPVAMPNAKAVLENRAEMCTTPMNAVRDAEALLLLTEWPEYRAADLDKVRLLMHPHGAALFDGRNIFDPKTAVAVGFNYYGVGRR